MIEMTNRELNIMLDKLSYAQLLLHSFSKQTFDEVVRERKAGLNAQIMYSPLIAIMNQLNDDALLLQSDMDSVCDFMYYERLPFEDLMSLFHEKALAGAGTIDLFEVQSILQSILHLSTCSPVDPVRLYSLSFLLPAVQKMVRVEVFN